MKKLLNFFLPKLAPQILLVYVIACAFAYGTRFIPQLDSHLEFEIFFMLVAFPLMCFLNKKISVSANADWILLTPTKKLSIIGANAIVNVIKLVSFIVLALIYFIMAYPEEFQKFFSGGVRKEVEITILTGPLAGTLLFIIFVSSILFSVTGNTRNKMLSHQEYKPSNDLSRDRRGALTVMAAAVAFLIIVPSLDVIFSSIPLAFTYAFFITLFIIVSVRVTLEALRFYYSSKKLQAAFASSLILFSLLLMGNAVSNLNDKSIPIDDRMDEYDYVYFFSPHHGRQIAQELSVPSEEVASMRIKTIKNYFEDDILNMKKLSFVRESWDRLCKEKKDYHCRLASYLVNVENNRPDDALLKASCPNNIRGCYEVLTQLKLLDLEKEKFEKLLASRCQEDEHKNKNKYCHSSITMGARRR